MLEKSGSVQNASSAKSYPTITKLCYVMAPVLRLAVALPTSRVALAVEYGAGDEGGKLHE